MLQNAWGFDGRNKLLYYKMNPKNMTVGRCMKSFSDYDVWFTETTPVITADSKACPPIDYEYVEKVMKHKHALIFVGGIATAIVGKKILESKTVKDACTQGMATVMAAKKDAEECFQDMRDNAEDIVVDANAEVKKEIYVEENKE